MNLRRRGYVAEVDDSWDFMSPEDRKEMLRLFKKACRTPSGSPLFLAIQAKEDELWKKYGKKPTMTDKEMERLRQYEKEGMKLKV